MGTASYKTNTVTYHEFKVPVGCVVELNKAIMWAQEEFKIVHNVPVQWDNDLLFKVDDENVIIYFTEETDA